MTPSGASSDTTDAPGAWLHVTDIGPVEPLDAQFGVHPKKTVPAALQDALFGQPAPSAAERAAFGEAPLATYAVLDAAKLPYMLTGLLDTSGLRYQSLFQGAAQEELAEHAPYLVELKEDHDFTRRLFIGPDCPGGLWDRDLGIFLRTRAGFDALRGHLRKFTRLQDETGKWFYFRFWEARYWRAFAALSQSDWLHGWPIMMSDGLMHVVHMVDRRAISRTVTQDFPRHFQLNSPLATASVEVMFAVVARPGIANAVIGLPRDHWIIPNLRRISKVKSIPDDLIQSICSLKVGSGAHILCQQIIENRTVPRHVLAQTLEYVVKSGGRIGL
jgi:hypothetical protein